MVRLHSSCSGTFKKSRASKTSCRRVEPVWVKVDATGLFHRQIACGWTSGVKPLLLISTVRPQSLPDLDQPASAILRRPKSWSRSSHQPLKRLSDRGYARLTFRCLPTPDASHRWLLGMSPDGCPKDSEIVDEERKDGTKMSPACHWGATNPSPSGHRRRVPKAHVFSGDSPRTTRPENQPLETISAGHISGLEPARTNLLPVSFNLSEDTPCMHRC